MDRARRYNMQEASELSGLSADAVYAVCERIGCSADAVPGGIVGMLRDLVALMVDNVVRRAGGRAA